MNIDKGYYLGDINNTPKSSVISITEMIRTKTTFFQNKHVNGKMRASFLFVWYVTITLTSLVLNTLNCWPAKHREREVWAAWSLRIPAIGDLDFLIAALPPLSVLSKLFAALESIHDIMNLFYDNKYYWLTTFATNCESM